MILSIHGAECLIDESDLPLVTPYKWYLGTMGYAVTAYHKKGSPRTSHSRTKNISMHRLLMEFPEKTVDHINRNSLDNRRANLRVVSRKQNSWNNSCTPGLSGYYGVRQEGYSSFVARIGKEVVGYFDSALKAAQARDIAIYKLRGEFAVLNFPLSSLPSYVEPLPKRNIGPRTSSVVGVSFSRTRRAKGKWRCVYCKHHIGWFESEAEAIEALMRFKYEDQICY